MTKPYTFAPSELVVLERACRTADLIDRLETELEALPELEVAGRFDQPQTHPHIEQIRKLTVLLERLCTVLTPPDESTKPQPRVKPASVTRIGGDRGRAS
jgi:hypothetical protein